MAAGALRTRRRSLGRSCCWRSSPSSSGPSPSPSLTGVTLLLPEQVRKAKKHDWTNNRDDDMFILVMNMLLMSGEWGKMSRADFSRLSWNMESSGEKIAFEASNGVTRPNNARECWGSQLKRVLGMKANTTCVRGRGWNIKERRQATTSSH